jgi:hypothetical protein
MPCSTFAERAPATPCHDRGVLFFDVGMTDAAGAGPVKCPSPAPLPFSLQPVCATPCCNLSRWDGALPSRARRDFAPGPNEDYCTGVV